jgi:hypothetical protein
MPASATIALNSASTASSCVSPSDSRRCGEGAAGAAGAPRAHGMGRGARCAPRAAPRRGAAAAPPRLSRRQAVRHGARSPAARAGWARRAAYPGGAQPGSSASARAGRRAGGSRAPPSRCQSSTRTRAPPARPWWSRDGRSAAQRSRLGVCREERAAIGAVMGGVRPLLPLWPGGQPAAGFPAGPPRSPRAAATPWPPFSGAGVVQMSPALVRGGAAAASTAGAGSSGGGSSGAAQAFWREQQRGPAAATLHAGPAASRHSSSLPGAARGAPRD